MRIVTSVLSIVSSVGAILAGIGIVAITLIIISDVVARYLFAQPFALTFDLSGFLLAGAVFLGLGYTFHRKAHIKMELVTSHLPLRFQTWLRLVTYVIGLGFVGVLTSQGWAFALRSYHENARSFGDLPLYIPQLAMALGLSLLALAVLLTIFQHIWLIRRGEGSNFSEAFDRGGREET